jgi:hypothetical protein
MALCVYFQGTQSQVVAFGKTESKLTGSRSAKDSRSPSTSCNSLEKSGFGEQAFAILLDICADIHLKKGHRMMHFGRPTGAEV